LSGSIENLGKDEIDIILVSNGRMIKSRLGKALPEMKISEFINI